jgi:hypothetical protein
MGEWLLLGDKTTSAPTEDRRVTREMETANGRSGNDSFPAGLMSMGDI